MEIQSRAKNKPFMAKDGSEIRLILDPKNSSVKNQSIAEALLQPGQKTTPHLHKKTEEIYFILDGEGRMGLKEGGKWVFQGMLPEEAVLIPPGTPHTIENTGSIPLRILCCCTPAYADKDTVLLEGA